MKALHLEPIKEPDKMLSYWKKEWPVVLMIFLSGTLFNACMSVGPILQGRIIDEMIAGSPFTTIAWMIVGFVLAITCIQFARYLKRYYVRIFANRTSASMRMMVYNDILHRDLPSLQGEKAGDLMNKAISDVNACVEGMRKFTTELFDTGVLMVSYFIILLYHDVKLTLLACLFIPVTILLAEKLKKMIYRFTKSYREALDAVSVHTYETVENAMLYRVYSAEETNLARYDKKLAALEKKAVLANLFENSMQSVYNAIAMIGVVFILYFGGTYVRTDIWSVGQFTAYLSIFAAFSVKAGKAAKLFNSVQKASISWKRIKPYMHTYIEDKPLDAFLPMNTGANQNTTTHMLTLKDAAFTYPGATAATLSHLNLQADLGELIGITGPVACGKTTFGLFLQGLFPYAGSIMINGQEVRDFPSEKRSACFSYTGHDSQLLTTTLLENITLGNFDARKDSEKLHRVLETVCFLEDLSTMPDGLETIVGASGVRLSGGQQARLSLARALYQAAPIFILDDPFAAVDVKTEQKILVALREHYKEHLILLITHRISCFEQADLVYLIENGTAISGSHRKMLEKSPTYQTIFAMQGGTKHENN